MAPYSFTWLYAALIISLILTFVATIICFVAASQLGPIVNSTSASANNQTASSMLYGAGAIGIFIVLLLGFSFYNIYSIPVFDPLMITPAIVMNARFGTGSLILVLLLFLLVILMLFFIIYALSLLDVTVSGTTNTGSSGRWWAIAAAVMMVIVLILMVYIGYSYYAYDAYLTNLLAMRGTEPAPLPSVITPGVPIVTPAPAPILYNIGNEFIAYRAPQAKSEGEFRGTLEIKGIVTTLDGQHLHKDLAVPVVDKPPIVVTQSTVVDPPARVETRSIVVDPAPVVVNQPVAVNQREVVRPSPGRVF